MVQLLSTITRYMTGDKFLTADYHRILIQEEGWFNETLYFKSKISGSLMRFGLICLFKLSLFSLKAKTVSSLSNCIEEESNSSGGCIQLFYHKNFALIFRFILFIGNISKPGLPRFLVSNMEKNMEHVEQNSSNVESLGE